MRQAGRYMAEYRDVRKNIGFVELCKTPRLAADVMLTAVDKLGVDAAIIFSDILLVLEPMGMSLTFSAGDGPVLERPLRTPSDVERIIELTDVSPLQFVFDVVTETRRGLDQRLPLIGFSGAPFTLAGYMIEGGGSNQFLETKRFMYRYPNEWQTLMNKLTNSLARYLRSQIDAGAQVVQIFDSWVGCLSCDDYSRYVLPATKQLIEQLRDIPTIYFGTGNPELLMLMKQAGSNVIGVDWRIDIATACERLGDNVTIQGNLDPAVLLSEPETIRNETLNILRKTNGRNGYIFNLGHGILPQTPVENVITLVETVHGYNVTAVN
jgi:uroporphyrinogen decarboxylase